ncbi:MAG TPA: hypothetical protein VFI45_07795, partial [Candidatus Acidoferrum sp.]|nr:hypothetical protein [Candidatus Acidoferrum sp.]
AEATRFPFPLPRANIGEQKAKVNGFFQLRIFLFACKTEPPPQQNQADRKSLIGDRAPVSSAASCKLL